MKTAMETMQIIYDNWENIVNFMDDEIREKVHFELAPCTEIEFLLRYCELDHTFENLLEKEYGIDTPIEFSTARYYMPIKQLKSLDGLTLPTFMIEQLVNATSVVKFNKVGDSEYVIKLQNDECITVHEYKM